MKVVILNDCFFDNDHLERLRKLGDLEIFNNTNSKMLVAKRIKNADIAIVDQFLTAYDNEVFTTARNLKLLALNSTSFSEVDIVSADKLKIKVANVPGFSRRSVAELAIGLMFAVLRNIPKGDKEFRNHPVDDLDPVSVRGKSYIGFDVESKVLGVLGLGDIGSTVAKMALGLGMQVVGFSKSKKNIKGIKDVGLKELLKVSDVVSVHLPLNSETEEIISKNEFELMKKNSIM